MTRGFIFFIIVFKFDQISLKSIKTKFKINQNLDMENKMKRIQAKTKFKFLCVYILVNFMFLIAAPYLNVASAQQAAQRIADEANSTVEISLGDTGNPVGPKVDVDEPTGSWTKNSPNAKKAYVWSKSTAVSTARATGEVFKDNFTAQSIAINAGAAFASKLYDQYNKGEKLDVISAAKFIVSGESICSFFGAALGATAGTAAGTLIATGVPVAGPVIGALMPVFCSLAGSTMGTQMGRDLDGGRKMSFKKAWAAIDKGDLIGRTIGATIGMTLGNMIFPGLGGFVGSVAGNVIGSKVVGLIRKLNDKLKKDKSGSAAAPVEQPEANPFASKASSPGFETSFSKNSGPASGSSDEAKKAFAAQNAYYQKYVALLNQGKGESAEASAAIKDYVKACEEYKKLTAK